jgi:hypothetical protein
LGTQRIKLDPEYFDDEEREAIESLHRAMDDGSLVSELTPEQRSEIQAAARATMQRLREEIVGELSGEDISKLKSLAFERGISDQRLLATIVRRNLDGSLTDRAEAARFRGAITTPRSGTALRQRRIERAGRARRSAAE